MRFGLTHWKKLGTWLCAVALVGASATDARAALGAMGPVDPADGFPIFYSDGAGLSLGRCQLPGAICGAIAIPNPAIPVAFPGNYPDEWFYMRATADVVAAGGTTSLGLALEGSFLNAPTIANGDQMVFARIRVRATGLVPGATYTVTHPYGIDTFVATAGALSINNTIDVGNTPLAFTAPLTSRVGPFLTWSPLSSAPPGFIGDGATPHVITGSAFGTNFLRIEGPGISTTCGVIPNCAQQDLFTVFGQIFGASVTSVSHASIRLANVGTPLTINGTAAPDATLVSATLGTATLTAVPAAGTWTISFPAATLAALPDGNVSLSVSVTTPSGTTNILTRTLVKDTTAPAPVTGLAASTGTNSVTLTWTNPPVDVATVRILRSTTRFATGPDDPVGQTVVQDAAGATFTDTTVVNGTSYFYTLFVMDPAANPSTAATVQATPLAPPPVGTLGQVFADNFNLCTATTNIGPNWTAPVSGYSCLNGKVRAIVANGVATSHTAAFGDMEAEARVLLDGLGTTASGVVVRASGGSYYAARVQSTGALDIVRVDAAGTTVLGTVPVSFLAGSFNKVTFRAEGTTAVNLFAWFNGALVLTATDTSAGRLLTGVGGLLSGTRTRTQFDDYFLRAGAGTVTPPPPPVTPPPPPPPPPTGAFSFADNFDACTSTVDLGPNWTTTGKWLCNAGRARGEVANRATAKTPVLGDTTIQARLNLSATGASGSGVFARGAADGYYAAIILATNRLQIVRVDAAGTTVLADVPASVPINAFETVKLQVSGTALVQLNVTYNGAPIASATDTSASRRTTGSAGLLNATTARVQYDDVSIKSP